MVGSHELKFHLKLSKGRTYNMWGRIVSFFNERGEGTAWDLDYGKLVIIGLCIYIAVMVSGCHSIGA